MPHETTLVATIAVGLAFAFLGGFLAVQLRLPPLLGYLLAGIAIGPFTPGFVADPTLAAQLAEIGVILLMFGVGMHFSVRDLLAVRRIAVPGALAQIVVATAMGAAVAGWWGWSLTAGMVFGLSLSVASTVVLLRALSASGRLTTEEGRIAVGWLIVEDLVMVLALVLLPALGGADNPGNVSDVWVQVAVMLGKVALFVALMLGAGVRLMPRLLALVERTGSRELFTLMVVALALGIAFGSAKLFGVSFALGAFFAGLVINESGVGHRATVELQSLQDMFAALFFVAMGMLFDPAILVRQPLQVLAVVAIIVVGKSLAALAIVLVLRYSMRTALTVAAALAQIGEFSFIMAGLGLSLGLLPAEGPGLIVAGALLSIAVNPLLVAAASRALPGVVRSPGAATG
ncbi:MAG: cation:proton antiporter [Gemmatimonadetes bacterium]|nr:cation:proton antiporter [Gemmatimonadota bacterium]